MDSQIVELFSRFLPPEIVEIIDDHLIAIYRKESAGRFSETVKQKIKADFAIHSVMTEYQIIVEDKLYSYYICQCGEVVCAARDNRGWRSLTHVKCKYSDLRVLIAETKELNWALRTNFRA